MQMKPSRSQKIEIIIEKNEDHFWGRIEDKGFMPTGQGETVPALLQNIKDSIEDYVEHEGKTDKFWSKVDLNSIEFSILYDLEAFFEEFSDLKISSIAKRADLNPSLVRQYATGSKYPSADQAKKIEVAIHSLAKKLQEASIYAE
jgi:predicted RNase H-like HicB family nuclease